MPPKRTREEKEESRKKGKKEEKRVRPTPAFSPPTLQKLASRELKRIHGKQAVKELINRSFPDRAVRSPKEKITSKKNRIAKAHFEDVMATHNDDEDAMDRVERSNDLAYLWAINRTTERKKRITKSKKLTREQNAEIKNKITDLDLRMSTRS